MSSVLIFHDHECEPEARGISKRLSLAGVNATVLADYYSPGEGVSLRNFIAYGTGHHSSIHTFINKDNRTIFLINHLFEAIDSAEHIIIRDGQEMFDSNSFVMATGYAFGKKKILHLHRGTSMLSRPSWYTYIYKNTIATMEETIKFLIDQTSK